MSPAPSTVKPSMAASAATDQAIQRKSNGLFIGMILFMLVITGLGASQLIVLYQNQDSHLSHFIFFLTVTLAPLLLLAPISAHTARRQEQILQQDNLNNRLESLKSRMDNREDLMRVIADHQPGAVMIFDRENRFWFVNKRAVSGIRKSLPEIIGRPPMRVFDNESEARRLEIRLAETRALETSRNYVDQVSDEQGRARFLQSHFELLGNLPDLPQAVLVSEEDLTPMIVERERRSRMLRQIIDTLVAVVDRRDPYAAGHSAKVGQLSQRIAVEMGLPEKDIEAAEIAGSLMNFGKVLVPREILTKTTPLTTEELQRVRDSILTSADILAIIGFDSPVVPTLRQVMERYDGTGAPDGIKGEEILTTSRIVALTNAFVALVSTRAHRNSLSFADAIQRLQQDSGKAFDGKVINTLAKYIENYPNRLDWLAPTKQAQG